MISADAVASDAVDINAPVEWVWGILIDFANYAAWNSFCPVAHCESLTLGAPLHMQVELGQGPQPQTEYFCRIEPNRVIAWRMQNQPDDPIHAVRTQTLTPLPGACCRYVSLDEFSGAGAAAMIELLGAAVEKGFNDCARDLKRYAEQRWARHRQAPTAGAG